MHDPFDDSSIHLLLCGVGGRQAEASSGDSLHSSHASEFTSTSSSSSQTAHQRLQIALEAIRSQHNILKQSLVNIPLVDTNTSDKGQIILDRSNSRSSTRQSRRTSVASGTSIWYDAPEPDGALEFVMEDLAPSESRLSDTSPMKEEPERIEEEEEDTDDDDSSKEAESRHGSVNGDATKSETQPQPTQDHKQVVRRTKLPSGPVADEGSLFSVLKKNVGKVRISSILHKIHIDEQRITGSLPSRITSYF
jgi:oxysterol-binding protein-related protein 3/6/7